MEANRSVAFVSLGCAKNLVDSERMVSTLLSRGFRVLTEPEDADLVVVNTCGFLAASRSESVEAIRKTVALKEEGPVQGVLVAGCMVGHWRERIAKEAPGVDRFVDFVDYERIDRLADEILPPQTSGLDFAVERRRIDATLTPAHYAYLKISEGCNHTCAFCVIPQIRGRMRSVPAPELVTRARGMAERGIREISLIAQDSTVYGTDLYGENRLPDLLRRLDQVEELAWIRLMYAYPTEVRAPLIEAIAESERVLPYLDVPVQHASSAVLKRMRRGYGRERLTDMVRDLRAAIPNVALRTTVIVGFPGETEEEFQELLDFAQESRFDRLGAFVYSPEERARANALEGQLPAELRQERWHRLMEVQRVIAEEDARAKIGQRLEVLVDAVEEDGRAHARTRADAPEVDPGIVLEARPEGYAPGDMLEVEVQGADGYDLRGVAVQPSGRA